VTDDRSPLLQDAVEALTQPTFEYHQRKYDFGVYRKPILLPVDTVRHAPLLTQLETAITSAIGNGGGGGSATGNVVNGDALYRAFLIRTELGDWCKIVGVRVTRDLITDLTAWWEVFKQTGNDDAFYIGQLRGWVRTIENLLDPPKRVPQDIPCPVCKATKWVSEEGATSPNPIVLEYKHENPLGTARVTCKACAAEWTSMEALNELKEELAEKESLENLTNGLAIV
jgi:hypothetical protein